MEHIDFDKIRISLASPDTIRKWSYGEVKKPETINYRTLKPEREGMFCERIFGPTKDWECHCGKYKKVRYVGKVCEKCGVEITTSKVRRERMGHIELAAPVSHIWYFRAIPSKMGILLDISPRLLEKVLYFAQYIVTDPGSTPLAKQQLLTEQEYRSAREKYENDFEAGMGAEAVKKLLQELDLDKLSAELREEMESSNGQKRLRLAKRLEIVEDFRLSGNKPEWMILEVLPVLPPEIRPLVQLDGGRFATSDINDLYRRVINRNNRLKRLMELHAPEIIIRNEKRMLQEAVDALIDNGRRGRPVTGPSNRPLKSLSEMLRGKQGRFRQNLLGKRVDYSGRSVIVVGPELKLYQCGLPKEMAIELFKPFVMKRLVETGKATNIKDAKKKVERMTNEVWDALEFVIKEHPVLLNRAPTLHRLSIQAFEPVLVEGRAIKLHPLVCTAFNADFDGDQMPVHVPLSPEAQAEARFLMLSANNLLKPVSGKAVTVPTQDMVLGSYWLTYVREFEDETPTFRPDEVGEGKIFRDFDEAVMAYENKDLGIHAKIKVRQTHVVDGEEITELVDTTYGRMIFNSVIPQKLHFVDRSDPKNRFKPEIDFVVTVKELGKIIDRAIKYCGSTETVEMLDKIKALGYKYSTKAALTVSVSDMTVPPQKQEIIAAADKKVDEVTRHFRRGLLTDEERYRRVISIWEECTKDVTTALQKNLRKDNPINMMAVSGARGSMKQMRQLAGMRGLMATATGRTVELPIKANFREGLNVLEYFIAARGSRKGLADMALRTADSGYLTRRLVDVAQDVIIREEDCGTTEGIWVEDIMEGKEMIEKLADRILGRFSAEDVIHPETGEVLVQKGEMISESATDAIVNAGIRRVYVRSVLNCKCRHGVCAHCYGSDLANGMKVNIGEAVGIIAAQSIGEPGTQLTMRTFHTGGIAGGDITQGLPRVEELFEARSPKKPSILADFDGTVRIDDTKKNRHVIVTSADGSEEKNYLIPYGLRLIVEEGQAVVRGQALTEGLRKPTDIIRIDGTDAAYEYIVKEIQKVYRLQAVEINDKHVEVIARQMTRKVRVENPGSTKLLPGAMVEVKDFEDANAAVRERMAQGEAVLEATATPLLLGITKAALSTESFLSAASFQETTKVLTEAAIKGKVDPLMGLKENVIIGKLIPAGTGMELYRKVEIAQHEEEEPEEAPAEEA
ncbi:MAG: DNA-directed RNA polymerase subunit beta' [Clostridia bacterium]|nr:DNA-directed RNA polymerase subunit beta' [Clostridia bacterium]